MQLFPVIMFHIYLSQQLLFSKQCLSTINKANASNRTSWWLLFNLNIYITAANTAITWNKTPTKHILKKWYVSVGGREKEDAFLLITHAVFRVIIVSWRSMHCISLCVINRVLTSQAHWNSILIGIGVNESIVDTYTKPSSILSAL